MTKTAECVCGGGRHGCVCGAYDSVVMYANLNDAAEATDNPELAVGDTEIWYMRPEQWRFRRPVTNSTLAQTHILLGHIACKSKNRTWALMQGDNWSPRGEANNLIQSKGLQRTSMSVGDVIVVDGKIYEVAPVDFVFISKTNEK